MTSSSSGPGRDTVLLAVAGMCVGAVALALLLQYRFDMQPCPWCILQRVIFLAIALVALLGLVWRGRAGAVLAGGGISALATAGMAAALWQYVVASNAESCDLTMAERIVAALRLDAMWPEVFTAYASCKDAAVKLLGLPFEFWSLALFIVIDLAAMLLLVKTLRR
ncbi:MAG: disulfide bond formation protein B [Rubrivivax sp.]|jgi:disulfide bond formation protein DsbB